MLFLEVFVLRWRQRRLCFVAMAGRTQVLSAPSTSRRLAGPLSTSDAIVLNDSSARFAAKRCCLNTFQSRFLPYLEVLDESIFIPLRRARAMHVDALS